MKELTLFADSRSFGLRFDNELDDLDPVALGLAPETVKRLLDWQRAYHSYDQLDDLDWATSIRAIQSHEESGVLLARQIQRDLGKHFRVRFYSQLEMKRIDL